MIVWPGLRRCVSAIQRLFNSAEFRANLTHSVIPDKAAPGTTGTFTRATTSTWTNNDGYLVTGVAGEIGFVGARRVRNLLTFTEDFSNAAWTKTGITATAGQLTEDGTTGVHRTSQPLAGGATFAIGTRLLVQVELKQEGRRYVQLVVSNPPFGATSNAMFDLQSGVVSSTGAGSSATITATSGGYYRCTLLSNAASSAAVSSVFINPSNDGTNVSYTGTNGLVSISVRKAQVEDVTAQTTQTAGEYVSVGVASSPYYHGSMVDGVKCFPTDLSGNPIPSTTLLGYQAQGTRTNYQPNSNAFTTTWSKTAGVTLTQNAVDDDGATTAWTAAITGAGQNITYGTTGVAANTICTLSMNMWPVDAGATRLAVYNTTGGAQFYADCNPTTGTITTGTSGGTITASGVIPIAGGGYRFWVAGSTGGTGAQTNNPVVYYGTDVDVKHSKIQFEIGSSASPYLPTTTTAVASNADVESVSRSGNIAAAAGSVYLEYTPTHSPSGTIALWGTYVDASNYTAILHDATNLICRKRIAGVNYDATIANAFVSGTTYKACATWGTSGTSITLNGTEGTPHANTTAAQIGSTMQWGADGNSLQQPFANIRNCRDWLRQLSASERAAVTA